MDGDPAPYQPFGGQDTLFLYNAISPYLNFWFPSGITFSWLSCVHLLYAGALRGQDPLMLSDFFLEVCLAESCCFPPVY